MNDYGELIKNLSEESCEEYGQTLLMREAAGAIEELLKLCADLRNELCLKCGRYKTAHEGACNGCRWERK